MYQTQHAQTVAISQLWASTEYQICGISVNVFGQASIHKIQYFSTLAMDTASEYKIVITGNLSEAYEEYIREAISFRQGVNPRRNRFVKRNAPLTSRRLQTEGTIGATEFVFQLYESRNQEGSNTIVQAMLTGDFLRDLKLDLATWF